MTKPHKNSAKERGSKKDGSIETPYAYAKSEKKNAAPKDTSDFLTKKKPEQGNAAKKQGGRK